MSSNPFHRSRRCNDITRSDTPPMRADFGAGAPSSVSILPLRPPGWRLMLVVILSGLLAGCAPPRPISPTRVPTSATAEPERFDLDQRARLDLLRVALAEPLSSKLSRGLVVRLAFDEAADLDLFVTDPAQESVYFANSPTRSGGTLIEDRRCEDPSPRIEVVNYADPASGRYRVGVDFHRPCQDSALSGPEATQGLYVVRVDEGNRVFEREGMVIAGQFEVIVLEFDVE